MNILVIDDAKDIRLLARTLIERHGSRVVAEAGDFASGLAAFKQCRPDLVLLDILLPDGNGVDLLKRIRTEAPQQAVLMLTTVADDAVMLDCLKAGACGYLLKDEPTWLNDLTHRLTLYQRRNTDRDEET